MSDDEQKLKKLHQYMIHLNFDCHWEFYSVYNDNVNTTIKSGQGIFIDTGGLYNDQ